MSFGVALVAAFCGYALGTVLALILDRMYTGAPFGGPIRVCEHEASPPLAWTGAIGYVLLRGRSADGCRLPARLWYLPLLGAVMALAIMLRGPAPLSLVLITVFSIVLLAFVGTDFERHLLPNRLMYPALTAAVIAALLWPDRTPFVSLAGGAAGFALMFILFIVFPGFGFGDVKLAGLIGLLVGAPNVFVALAAGIMAGGVGVLFMLVTRKANRKTAIAYGPYLILGAFYGMLMLS